MGVVERVGRDVRFFRGLLRTLRRRALDRRRVRRSCSATIWRRRSIAGARGRRSASPAQALTYGELDALANRFAHWAPPRA